MTEMEDSAKMTIDFLRARLLAERSVSKSARQRADELAERVVALEEQLKAVTLQRNKAEKATAEVLAILGNHRLSDFSETYDSSSDQEGSLCESKEGTEPAKKEQSFVTSNARMNTLEFSGSEPRSSPVTGRSLSWKKCTESPTSFKSEYMDQSRRSSSFNSKIRSSSRRNLGKSCRQLKRKEIRSGADEGRGESFQHGTQGNGESIMSRDTSNGSKDDSMETTEERSKTKEEKVFLEDMERALEHQAQLIVRYEAEENAQREWEEKFREDNSCTPDSCEPGNQSDITEERDEIRAETVDPRNMQDLCEPGDQSDVTEEKDEIRAETVEPAYTIPSHDHGVRSVEEYVCHDEDKVDKHPSDGVVPTVHAEMGCLPVQQHSSCSSGMVNEVSTSSYFSSQLKTETNTRGKEKLELLDKSLHQPFFVSSEHRPQQKSSCHVCENFCEGESSVEQNKTQLVSLHETKDGLHGVLEALQHAKSSLKQKLDRLPLSSLGGPIVGAKDAPFPANKDWDAMEIPVGCAGLFRVPTDLKFENTAHHSQISLLGPFPDSHLSLTRYSPNMGVGGAASGDIYTASPYMESGLSSSTQKSYLDSYMDMSSRGIPASSRYTYPSYADLVLKTPSVYGDGIQRLSSVGTMPSGSGDQNYIYHDQIRPNTHR
ncbi:uncharacterized protein LOC122094106 [Macadamia integrifolia]|uniref:uncharacterized protein LOC122094106 n=1 Tax=Macadamia integrifolia TaxID=60698 RepID=UPI001C52FF18|nr:uncharacterized protein LOC122094106 [Macadamia integrifolia]XP_042520717.1 uncharacterized protein LOC122094106 [Macadamia integrifolia]